MLHTMLLKGPLFLLISFQWPFANAASASTEITVSFGNLLAMAMLTLPLPLLCSSREKGVTTVASSAWIVSFNSVCVLRIKRWLPPTLAMVAGVSAKRLVRTSEPPATSMCTGHMSSCCRMSTYCLK